VYLVDLLYKYLYITMHGPMNVESTEVASAKMGLWLTWLFHDNGDWHWHWWACFLPYRHFFIGQQVLRILEIAALLSNANIYEFVNETPSYLYRSKTVLYYTMSLFLSVCSDLDILRRQIVTLRCDIIIFSLLL
jgi:hypothetical protein